MLPSDDSIDLALAAETIRKGTTQSLVVSFSLARPDCTPSPKYSGIGTA